MERGSGRGGAGQIGVELGGVSAEQGTGAKGVSQTRSKLVLMPALALVMALAMTLALAPQKLIYLHYLTHRARARALEEKWSHSICTGRKCGLVAASFRRS